MRLRIFSGVGLLAAAALLSGCDSQPATVKMADTKVDAAAKLKAAQAARVKRAAEVKANELGQIPVLMFHRVIDKPGSTDDRTPQQFRADLERLAREGYVPITAAEMVAGRSTFRRASTRWC